MKTAENEQYFKFEIEKKQFDGAYDQIWKVILFKLPMNELVRAKMVCKEFYQYVTQLQLNHPSWIQGILHQVGYSQNLTAKLLQRNPNSLENETLFSTHTRQHTVFFNLTGNVIQCGQLGLTVRDHQAPLYVIDDQHRISVFTYQDCHLMGQFVGHQTAFAPQTVIALDRDTVASGDINGNIFVWHLSQVAKQPEEENHDEETPVAPARGLKLRFFRRSSTPKKSAKPASKTLPQQEQTLTPFGKHKTTISAMARIDSNHFISADRDGVIQFWDVRLTAPLRTIETEDSIRALCYFNSRSVLYMTYEFNERGFKHDFNVWQFDGNTKNLYYSHEYINATQVESLPRMACYITPGFGLFTDPTIANNLIFHMIQRDKQNNSKKAVSENGGYNYEKAVCSFFTPAGYVGIVNKGKLPSNYKVTLFEHLTQYNLPTESALSLVFK